MSLSRVSKKRRRLQTMRQRKPFTEHDYQSGEGMITKIWGPAFWHFLHTISFNYPVHPTADDQRHYRDFLLQLRYILPCKYCRQNIQKNIRRLPLTRKRLKDRDSFSRYMYQLHELVNKMLKKHSHLSFEDVRDRYEHFRSRCTNKKKQLHPSSSHREDGGRHRTLKRKEKGCVRPLHGRRSSKCILKIVPQDHKEKTFQVLKK